MKHTLKHEQIEYWLMGQGLKYPTAHKIALQNEKRKESLKKILKDLKRRL
jgi:hypothetical protein